jgi:hypothetical protein
VTLPDLLDMGIELEDLSRRVNQLERSLMRLEGAYLVLVVLLLAGLAAWLTRAAV